MDHIELHFRLHPKDPFADILTAELAEAGFDTFEETPDGLKAYIPSGSYYEELLKNVKVLNDPELKFTFTKTVLPKQNWNEEWERNFPVVEVGTDLLIRAPFHPSASNKYRYEIVIEPKMSFGTGHHDTTWLMAQQLLKADVEGRKVLDMGCGTGILAILAAMRGARSVDAIDIEEWAFLNTKENAERNGTINIHVEKGDVNLLAGRSFQLILANINRNVLLQHLGVYSACLARGGELMISGFFESDRAQLEDAAKAQGLILLTAKVRNNWAMLHFSKQDA